MSEGLMSPSSFGLSYEALESLDIGLVKDWLRVFDIKHLNGHLAILTSKDWTVASLFSKETVQTCINEIESELSELWDAVDPYADMDESAIRARYTSLTNEMS